MGRNQWFVNYNYSGDIRLQPILTKEPVVKVGMLICTPVTEVLEVFVNPEITTEFWFMGLLVVAFIPVNFHSLQLFDYQ